MITDVKPKQSISSNINNPSPLTGNVNNASNLSGKMNVGSIHGKSAYEIAVENGFIGTEEEWLESLHGNDYIITEKDYEEISKHIKADVDYLTVVDGMLCMKYTEVE